ncbi:3-hydroxyacyl-ACP dehydratase FabZ [Oscillospiraceae bacterium MB08-C2-2]|nr:3-hydroxyacyl-ACP dehydratase FabZ [Oscillospiraceae bacterium MB08-C2-2]
MVLLNQEQIKEIIPHRDPFLLIDEVIALEPGVKCVARRSIREDDFWFAGHFPQMPVTPGVLMVEMLAQTGAVCAGSLEENKGKIGLFAKIDKAKFRKPVVAGDVLTLEVEMIKLKSMVGVGRGTAYNQLGDKVVSCELTFAYTQPE